jgi:PKD domain.
MKQKILLFTFFVLLSIGLQAQGEAAHWYFGRNSGMDFTSMYVVNNAIIDGITGQTLTNVPAFDYGPINTGEGCFSVSDANGNFYFASDGRYIYNKNKALMPHGSNLKGHSSTTQSGLVIPRAQNPHNYYVVTAPAGETQGSRNDGIYYYEVDMTLDGSLGDVLGPYNGMTPIGTELNFDGVYATKFAYENLAAVKHSNGIDYWLLNRTRDHFFVWKVTKDGIDPTPVKKFSIGYNPGDIYVGGGLKISSNGEYIVCVNPRYEGHPSTNGTIVVAKFDTTSGEITDIRNNFIPQPNTIYGVVFSPNNKYVYYSNWYAGPLMRLSLESLLNGTVETPKKISDYISNVQIGPDQRLYGITSHSNAPAQYQNLYIVLNPNDNDPSVAVIPNYFPAGTGSHLSLPTFSASFFYIDEIKVDMALPACVKTEMTFTTEIVTGTGADAIAKVEWDFGDGKKVWDTNMSISTHVLKHTYSQPGTYTLTLTPYGTDDIEKTDRIKKLTIPISRCILPVNHNISVMGYYD